MEVEEDEDKGPPVDYDLTCWYINARRVMELAGTQSYDAYLSGAGGVGLVDDIFRKNAILARLKESVVAFLDRTKPPTLGQLIQQKKLSVGQPFTHYQNFFFKGLNKVTKALQGGKHAPMAEGYSKLDLQPGTKLTFQFSHEHLTSNSAWVELSGQKRMLFFGIIKEIKADEIVATPYVIANPIPSILRTKSITIIGSHWMNRLEVFVEDIEQFGDLREYSYRAKVSDLQTLKDIPENKIKHAFADLLGVPSVPKDWGGETSDLFSPNLTIGGQRVSTAFLFKGPAKFHPMTMADLGKNGDQINRLATEPADLLVIQHCHEITTAVRAMMRAFAQQFGNLRLYCVIDGYDTLRILEKNSLCGLSPREILPHPRSSFKGDEELPPDGDEGNPEDYIVEPFDEE